MTNKMIELATVDTAKILDGRMQWVRVNTILKQLGFVVLERTNRSPVAKYSVPQWFHNLTGNSTNYYNTRELAVRAIEEWDHYVNPNIESNRIVAEPESESVSSNEPESTVDPEIVELIELAQLIAEVERIGTAEEVAATEPEPLELEPLELAAPVVATGTITAIVKIVNPNGKFEIIESSDPLLVPVAKTYNSTLTAYKQLGSFWAISCHLTRGDSGSLKIDSIEPFERTHSSSTVATVATVATSGTVTTVNAPVAPEPPVLATGAATVESVSSKTEPEPDRTITANLDEWIPNDYYISPNARLVFKMAVNCLKRNSRHSVKILMTGDPGYGKTTIAERVAEFLGFQCYRMNCAAIRDTEEWYFDREVKTVNGELNTVFTDSDFVEILRRGNCVMILDEFNRLESNLHNSLFPLLDDSGSTRLHHREYTVGENVIFVATVNLGRENSGTFLLDDALTNRFDMILEVRPLPFDHECAILTARYGTNEPDSESIVRLATILRENDFKCSTRDTLKIAKLVSVGMEIRDAFEFVIVLRIPEDESNAPIRKALVDLVNKQLGTRGIEFAFAS